MAALTPPLLVTGLGLASSLGDTITACAAARASLTRPSLLPFAVEDREQFEMIPVSGRTCGELTAGFAEVGLATRLFSLALTDLFRSAPLTADELEKSAVLLNMGSGYYPQRADEVSPPPDGPMAIEQFEATRPLYQSVIQKGFRASRLQSPPAGACRTFFEDQAGVGTVLTAAHQLLTEGSVTSCIVAGVDSLAEPRWLQALETLGLLKTALRPVGLIPGEAAAMLLLELPRRSAVASVRRVVQAHVTDVDLQRERSHRFSETHASGEVLATLIRGVTAMRAEPIFLLSDLNGDAPRAADFGGALARLTKDVRIAAASHPATCFGDTRAAAGFLATCMAVRSFARGYAPAPCGVVTAMNDDGARAVVGVSRAH